MLPQYRPASVPSFEVKLPSASVGAEYIIVFGSNQANLTGKALTLIADGSDVIPVVLLHQAVLHLLNTQENLYT
ncbi:MAG: hypothetical protein CM15mV52_0770 [uncultured marine virus]|nr:MAG: hypothetical protein CM15mV52_0770 [uncultured marine virus]